ncbi:hypothetical protein AAFC00_002015 [Neodothiora populina]|uniref:UV-endonuclease UvdE n=1 Tax=Neodothiora populina TaxID=2781224 RepID=A0ABR3PG01_9PEZI
MAPKRKRTVTSSAAPAMTASVEINPTNPQVNPEILDAPNALRASPDSDVDERIALGPVKREVGSESPLSDVPEVQIEPPPPPKKRNTSKAAGNAAVEKETAADGAVAETKPPKTVVKKAAGKGEDGGMGDPEAEGDEEADEEEVKEALARPPPVNSDYLPLPWKGRLGYACLNTYLRYSTPPVFSSRTCRIASILEHRHPLQDPTQPEHATKNRPDREKPADIELGRRYVEAICLANVKDIAKMIKWNDKYGIKFLRLSSEMFPFASHGEYGYKLAPFASEALAEAGQVIGELGHRVTTHPGQFTQLGSPRKSVIDNAMRDLEYHDEMLSLLKLPEQANRDAVMILHMGGMFGDKGATLDRFRENYAKLSQSVKNRLVLENDDVIWTVHDLLPVCEELNIPMVLDFHHHNIMFDADQIREGTADIVNLFPRVKATWDRKGIKQKMHYSEPTPAAITGRQRRKHSPRVATLPPCAPDMDLMIEAKDKEQAVFELMRIFKLPGYDTFNDILPHVRSDDNKFALQQATRKKATPKKAGKKVKTEPEDEDDNDNASVASTTTGPALVPDEEVGMGGPEGRVYWPPTMEDWIRPKKREVKPKKEASDGATLTPAQKRKAKAAEMVAAYEEDKAAKAAAASQGADEEVQSEVDSDEGLTPATKKAKAIWKAKAKSQKVKAEAQAEKSATAATSMTTTTTTTTTKKSAAAPTTAPKRKAAPAKKIKKEAVAATPPTSSEEDEGSNDDDDASSSAPTALDSSDGASTTKKKAPSAPRGGARKSGRAGAKQKVSYQEEDLSMDDA